MSAPTQRTLSESTDPSTARFVLPAESFALTDLFERVPDARVECESAVANPDDHALLVIEAGEHKQDIDTALRSDPSVADVECFGERADGWTYRVTWKGRPRRLIQRLVAADVSLTSMQSRNGEWQFQLLAPDREGIARAHDIMEDLDCEADCRSISSVDRERSNGSGLTPDQHEALVTAFEKGYYKVPRDITAAELADELDISHQALSERFRRAYQQLLRTALVVDDGEKS
ncbi:DNA binding domain-containing protein [Halococcus thailandensis JCM 13552]|uniref:DNA binding domain-containing protein n=1 Tax=Halococcus thailandensis JCM 13552 TaxID=1227457 RepID=M0N4S0_9EURY|nr:DNA binding domain-containing protein [Halococcus thailandensis JCM 13552]